MRWEAWPLAIMALFVIVFVIPRAVANGTARLKNAVAASVVQLVVLALVLRLGGAL